ncbi:MAG TPA: 2OG-Fe(II) oxygenase [Methylovirgula sp.]|nr:2OG-Fe(II) oxygenase [Methylovirgula sp.]
MLYLQKTEFDAAPLATDPFPHTIVRHFIAPDAIARIGADFPSLPGPGAFPPAALKLRGHFAGLIDELTGPWLRDAVAQKFAIDLDSRPLVWTVRGYLRERDGGVHTDSESKLVTLLLYLNEDWQDAGGRLRLLRSPDSLMTPVVEVPPLGGTLLCFARSDRSWHGHLPFAGKRRAIQLNFMCDARIAAREQRRHLLSARVKQAKALFRGA